MQSPLNLTYFSNSVMCRCAFDEEHLARGTSAKLACVAWRFCLGALSNKGGRGQRNREEIGAEAIWFLFFSRLRRSFSRASRANFAATPVLRPARQNRHATQATAKWPWSYRLKYKHVNKYRGVATGRGGGVLGYPWPPLVGHLLSKQPTIFQVAKTPWQYLGRKSHCWKAHVNGPRQRPLSLVNMGLHAAMIRLQNKKTTQL